jgi:Antibiotic biosynthesis monooxygenase
MTKTRKTITEINPDENILTLINTFDVELGKQQELVDLLAEATTDVMRHLDGFISANIHQSSDGSYVAN